MPIIVEYSFDDSYSRRRDLVIAVARSHVHPHELLWTGVSQWLATEFSEANAIAEWRERQKQERARHMGQPTPPGARAWGGPPVGELAPPGDSLRAARLEAAFAALYAKNRRDDPLRLLGEHSPRRERQEAAARAVVVAGSIVDPDAGDWLSALTDLSLARWTEEPAARPAIRGRGEVFRRRGHAALAMLEEAGGVLGWPMPPGGPYREPGPVRVRNEELVTEARRRAAWMPEPLWHELKRWQGVLSLPPYGGDARSRGVDVPEAVIGLRDAMMARVELVSAPGFRARDYPGQRPEARRAEDDGWAAWHILPVLRDVLAFAIWRGDPRQPQIRAVEERIRAQAAQYIFGRLAASVHLEFNSVSACRTLIEQVLAGEDRGGDRVGCYPTQWDRVNKMLDVPPAWPAPPRVESEAESMIRQLRAQGTATGKILAALKNMHLGGTPEAAELRRELAEVGQRDGDVKRPKGTAVEGVAPVVNDANDRVVEEKAATQDGDALGELEAKTPPLTKGDGAWVRSSTAAEIEGLEAATLATYRFCGLKNATDTLGRDNDGRVWRRVGTKTSHPWYLRSTLQARHDPGNEP